MAAVSVKRSITYNDAQHVKFVCVVKIAADCAMDGCVYSWYRKPCLETCPYVDFCKPLR